MRRQSPPRHAPPAASEPRQPPHHRRFYDPAIGGYALRLHPGDYQTTGAADETITTILGSCVAACIRNPFKGYGGMNHFMLPSSDDGEWAGAPAALRYGNHAMEVLINAVMASGCGRADLEIKLFGGADFFGNTAVIGGQNARFAQMWLKNEGLRPMTLDLGGDRARVIQYTPATGVVKRRLLEQPRRQILEEELRYRETLAGQTVEGDIEMFI